MSNDFNPLSTNYTELQIQYHRFKGDDSTIAASNFCRQLIANSVSRLSLKLYKETNSGRKEIKQSKYPEQLKEVAYNPNDFQTWPEFIRSLILNMIDTGNGYGMALRNPLGNIAVIMPVENAAAVNIQVQNGKAVYTVPSGVDFKLPKQKFTKKEKEVIHAKGLTAKGLYGQSIEYENRTAFELMRKAERHGMNWFDNAFSPTGIFTMPDEIKGPQYLDEAKQIHAMAGLKGAGKAVVLKPGFGFQAVQSDNRNNQFIELKEFLKREIMTAYGVPLGMLLEGGQDFDKAQMAFYKGTVSLYCHTLQLALNAICPDGFHFEFDTDEFIKGDPIQQIQFIREGISSGIFTVNEGRTYMGYEAVEGGDVHAVQTNNITLGSLLKIQEMQDAQTQALLAASSAPSPAPQQEPQAVQPQETQALSDASTPDINTGAENDN